MEVLFNDFLRRAQGSLLERLTALEKRIDELDQDNQKLRKEQQDLREESQELHEESRKLREENQKLRETNQELREENKRLRAKLRWYEGPHTPPSKEQSSADESSSSSSEDDDDSARTDSGTPGRKPGHEPAYRGPPEPDREVEVTCDCCPECGEGFDESVGVSHSEKLALFNRLKAALLASVVAVLSIKFYSKYSPEAEQIM